MLAKLAIRIEANDRIVPAKEVQRVSEPKKGIKKDLIQCAKCHKWGTHTADVCRSTKIMELQKTSEENKGKFIASTSASTRTDYKSNERVKCYNCGLMGHISPHCPSSRKENISGKTSRV